MSRLFIPADDWAPVVFVVEPNPFLRKLICIDLAEAGYVTLSAASREEAYCRIGMQPEAIDLVIADMEAVGLTSFASWLTAHNPDARLLLLSALPFHRKQIATWLHSSLPAEQASLQILEKPFRMSQLIQRVEEMLGAPTESHAASPSHSSDGMALIAGSAWDPAEPGDS